MQSFLDGWVTEIFIHIDRQLAMHMHAIHIAIVISSLHVSKFRICLSVCTLSYTAMLCSYTYRLYNLGLSRISN